MNDHTDQIEVAGEKFGCALKSGEQPQIETFLRDWGEPERSQLLRSLLTLELDYRRNSGETPALSEYTTRFPEHAELLEELLVSFGEQSTFFQRFAGLVVLKSDSR